MRAYAPPPFNLEQRPQSRWSYKSSPARQTNRACVTVAAPRGSRGMPLPTQPKNHEPHPGRPQRDPPRFLPWEAAQALPLPPPPSLAHKQVCHRRPQSSRSHLAPERYRACVEPVR